jgi:hypothetical protein
MKTFILEFIKFTFIGYFIYLIKNRKLPKLKNLKSFWKSYPSNKLKKGKKVVLVECLEKVNPNFDSYYKLVPMLGKIYDIKVIALTTYKSLTESVNFLSNYHKIDSIESVYSFFDFKIKIKALKYLIKNKPFSYTNSNGIDIFVEDVNIGDLIYDEYLRKAKKETLRKANLLFYLIAYNAIYAFLKYKKIMLEYNVTDIIAIRDTYSHSSFYRASDNLENITIWKNVAGAKQSGIRKLKAYKTYNFKPLYLEKKHILYIKKHYNEEEINKLYLQLIEDRKIGNVSTRDAKEIKLAHSQNEIKTIESFKKYYKYDTNKFNVVIYAHVFVDAVRYSHYVIFSDHYTWLIETLKYLINKNDINIFLKPHPSEKLYNLGKNAESVVNEFNLKYNSNIIFLDKKIDSSVIYELSDVIITGSGTVAIEAPCEGKKVITAGSNSYENTNAMFRSKTQKEYFNLLDNIKELPNLTKEQIFNSKVGFIWLNKIKYVKTNICVDINLKQDFIKQFKELDSIYKNAKDTDVDPLMERMLDNEIN